MYGKNKESINENDNGVIDKLYLKIRNKVNNVTILINGVVIHMKTLLKTIISHIDRVLHTLTIIEFAHWVIDFLFSGTLMASLLMLFMLLIGYNYKLFAYIQDSMFLTLIVLFVSGCALYYILNDFNKTLSETWRRRNR